MHTMIDVEKISRRMLNGPTERRSNTGHFTVTKADSISFVPQFNIASVIEGIYNGWQ